MMKESTKTEPQDKATPTLREPDHDSLLMLKVKDGDRQAFAILFNKYVNPLHHFVYRFVGNAAVAEELIQEIFFKIYRAAPNYEPKGQFSTFLYRVATNHCLNEVRRARYRERFESLSQLNSDGKEGSLELPDEKGNDAEKKLIGSRLAEQLQKYLLELPENQRAALLLHRLDALSYQNIAETMNLTVASVKSLIHRAKTTLQKRLEVWDNENKRTQRVAHQ